MARSGSQIAERLGEAEGGGGRVPVQQGRYALPALTALGGIVSGILVDFYLAPPFWVYVAVFLMGAAGAVGCWALRHRATKEVAGFSRRACSTSTGREPRHRAEGIVGFVLPAAVGLAGCSIGGVRHADSFRRIGPNHIAAFTAEVPVAVRVRGVVRSEPRTSQRPRHVFAGWLPHRPRSSFLLDVREVKLSSGWSSSAGRVRINVKEPLTGVTPGDGVELYGRLSRLMPTMNPGQFDWRTYRRRSGVLASISVDHAEAVRVVERGDVGVFRRMQRSLRNWASRLLIEDLPADAETGGLLRTLVLGQRQAVDRALNEAFVRTGTAHFLAVSGLHVGMIAGVVLVLARVLRVSRRGAMMLSTAVIVGYVVVAEPRAPILRAGVMGMLLAVAVFSRRPVRRSLWLPTAGIILLVAKPTWLFSPSFQLSFAVVTGVIYLTPAMVRSVSAAVSRLRGRLPAEDPLVRPLLVREFLLYENMPLWRHMLVWSGWYAAVCLSAWLVGAPLAAYHFGQVSPLGFVSSLVLCAFVFLVLVCSCGKLLLSLVLPTAGLHFAAVLAFATDLLATVVRFMETIPGMSLAVSPPPVLLLAGYYVLLAGWAWRRRIGASGRWRAGLGGILLLGMVYSYWPVNPARDGLRVTCLSVGGGSATLIELPDGRNFIYDAGTQSTFDVGGNVVVPAARALGIKNVEAAIVSHPNLDHFSGLPAVYEAFGVKRVYVHEHFEALAPSGGAARFLLDLVAEAGIERRVLTPDDVPDIGEAEIRVLWPPRRASFSMDANESSLVVKLTFGGRSVLFCGDIEAKAQAALLGHPDLRADVLVLPHHGAYVRNTAAFAEAVGAKVLIRSTGHRDAHSNPKLLALADGRRYYSTAEDGAVTVVLTAERMKITPFLQRR